MLRRSQREVSHGTQPSGRAGLSHVLSRATELNWPPTTRLSACLMRCGRSRATRFNELTEFKRLKDRRCRKRIPVLGLVLAVGLLPLVSGCAGLVDLRTKSPVVPEQMIVASSTLETKRSPRKQNPRAIAKLQEAADAHREGRLRTALKYTLAARRIDPTLSDTYLWEVEIRFDLQDPTRYRQSLLEAIQATRDSATAQNSIGRRMLEIGLQNEGISALRKAVSMSPQDVDFVQDLSAALIQHDFPNEAYRVLADAIQRLPNEPSLQIAAARLDERAGRWEAAVRLYDVVLKHDMHNLTCRRQRARGLYQIGAYARCADDYEICIGRKDKFISVNDYVQLGDALLRNGDPARARRVFDRVSQSLQSPVKDVELLRAFCAIKEDNVHQARGILHAALVKWPSDTSLQRALKLCDATSDKGSGHSHSVSHAAAR